jgi:hypothetical protein
VYLNRALHLVAVILFTCLSLSALAQPEPIKITPAPTIEAHFQFWEDAAGDASIDQVISLAEERWTLEPNGSATFGLTQSAYWLRFEVSNQTQRNLNLIAELGYSQLDDVVFYVYSGRSLVKELKTGDSLPFYPRDVDHPSILLRTSLAPDEMKTVYVRAGDGRLYGCAAAHLARTGFF